MLDLARELHELVHAMDRHAAELLRPLGLSLRQHVALIIIGEHPGLAGRDLADGLQVSPAATTAIVRGLVEAGWVEDAAPPGSGNRQSLRLTEPGHDTLRAATAALGTTFDDAVRAAGEDPLRLAESMHSIRRFLLDDPRG